jgi:hypothetical protein
MLLRCKQEMPMGWSISWIDQSSMRSPATFPKSREFRVSKVAPRANAIDAIRRSIVGTRILEERICLKTASASASKSMRVISL